MCGLSSLIKVFCKMEDTGGALCGPFARLFDCFIAKDTFQQGSPLLLCGEQGSGKSFFLKNLSQEITDRGETVFLADTLDFLPKDITDPTHVDLDTSDTTKPILALFQACINNAPSWLFLDHFDILAASHESSGYASLLASKLHSPPLENIRSLFISMIDKVSTSNVQVIAAVECSKFLFPKFTRSGRFDRVLKIPVPSKKEREELLHFSLRSFPFDVEDDVFVAQFKKANLGKDCTISNVIRYLAENTPGFVPKDIRKLVYRIQLDMREKKQVSWNSLEKALLSIRPSHSTFVEKGRDTTSKKILNETVAGCHELKESIRMLIQLPLLYPSKFARFNLTHSHGMLLHGPPGCGKTFATKIVLRQLLGQSVNVITVQGPRLFSKYVGDTEESIRSLFISARKISPCVLVIDELDALGAKRNDDESGGVHERALSTLLNEIDGVEQKTSVYIIGCTSKPEWLDPALTRPGRLDRVILLKPPSFTERLEMLSVMEAKMPLQLSNEEKQNIVERTDHYSYAEMKGICREAALNALRHSPNATFITKGNFDAAFFTYHPKVKINKVTS